MVQWLANVNLASESSNPDYGQVTMGSLNLGSYYYPSADGRKLTPGLACHHVAWARGPGSYFAARPFALETSHSKSGTLHSFDYPFDLTSCQDSGGDSSEFRVDFDPKSQRELAASWDSGAHF
jgi:hypothetical protein